MNNENRRPLTTRSTAWARFFAEGLVRAGVKPDHISIFSIFVSMAGAYVLVDGYTPETFVIGAVCVQLRLLCNMLDGMVAIEGGKKSAYGPLYNELPDRIADTLFIVALGYLAGSPVLGWFGALAAALTAYIRAMGGALGFEQDFRGPLAKPHRMAVMTAGLLLAAIELAWVGTSRMLLITAWVIAIGSVATCVTRTASIAAKLKARA